MCEAHFQQNVRRNQEGRFIVKLPVDDEKLQQLGDTKEIARRRFLSLERRLLRHPDIRSQYRDFMREYIKLGHMSEVKESMESELSYYLPHHAVLKESSTTTKLRVVFDASCKGTTGLSLNDALLVGPNTQDDLFSILTRFRTFRFAMTADITKMYRQVHFDKSQRSLQRIFWRENPQDELKTFELHTVTYGTASASFLAIRSLRKLAEDESNSFPIGARTVLRDFYVDDLLTGASTVQEALEIKEQAIKLLSKGGFELRKWSSNHPSLQDTEISPDKEFNFIVDHSNETRALGIVWNYQSDIFKFLSIGHLPPLEKPIKRSILARIALTFDPLGLLGPLVMIAKMVMQDLWRIRVEWDESISLEMSTRWKEYEHKLQVLSKIEIPRKVIAECERQGLEIHGFSDASIQAYGACIYLRSVLRDGKSESYLLCSKSRLAPLKTLSIPRLELCGTLLLAQLLKKVQDNLPIKIDSVYLWTDSRIVLCWLQSCSRQWTTFVANRIAEIQRITNVDDWRHVASQENPADLLSRGIMPDLLQGSDIWWHGPCWLRQDRSARPLTYIVETEVELPEGRRTALTVGTNDVSRNDIIDRFSKFSRLVRSVAFCFRFARNCKLKLKPLNGSSEIVQPLSVEELEQSERAIVKMIQREAFKKEIQALEDSKCINKNSNISKLNPFIDSHGILRVGGRLKFANISYNYKHPILLPGKQFYAAPYNL